MTEKTTADSRPEMADEEGWFVKIRPSDVKLLKSLGVALLLTGLVGCWLLWRIGDKVEHATDVYSVERPVKGGK